MSSQYLKLLEDMMAAVCVRALDYLPFHRLIRTDLHSQASRQENLTAMAFALPSLLLSTLSLFCLTATLRQWIPGEY